jgi:hypothetical protein
MRVDPMMQLNQAITSAFEAIVYPSLAVLLVALVAFVAVAEVRRSRTGRRLARDRSGGRDHDHRAVGLVQHRV